MLEATRACSQCLTIFGEKWPGAVRYADIFEALSGGVIRAIMEPEPGGNLGKDLGKDLDMLVDAPASIAEKTGGRGRRGRRGAADPLLGAVKDVFMEVDEDAPGGWQGWRVFTEMVQSDIQVPELAAGDACDAGTATGEEEFTMPDWGESSAFSPGTLEGAHVSEGGTFTSQGGWDHGFFAGYD